MTRALTKRSTLKARINKAIHTDFVNITVGEAKVPKDKKFANEADLEANLQGNYNKVIDLIEEYDAIVAAIVKSNANTEITIAGRIMSVASAIEQRNSMEFTETLLQHLTLQLANSHRLIERQEEELTTLVERRAANANIEGTTAEELGKIHEDIAMRIERKSKYEICDPNKVVSRLPELNDRYTEFRDELEVQLNIINATTTIEY